MKDFIGSTFVVLLICSVKLLKIESRKSFKETGFLTDLRILYADPGSSVFTQCESRGGNFGGYWFMKKSILTDFLKLKAIIIY